jgi:nitrite reductase/ring-hydroxylating ferredoxin subunit
MKKLVLVFGIAAISAMAADVTGYIIDKNCASKKAMLGNEACAKSCIGKGAPAVLATEDGKIYAISNQDKVKDVAGKKVTVSGKVEGESITVDSVKAETN